MKYVHVLLISFLVFVTNAPKTMAQPPEWPITHAIAMHGPVKYPTDFQYLDYVNPDAPKGGVLKRAEFGSFDSFNPNLLIGQTPTSMIDLSYWDPLMRRVWDEPFSLYGLIAEKIAIAPDRSALTFYLNPKAVFHDGHPILVEDVLFTLDVLQKHGRPNARRIYKLVKSFERHDDRAVTLYFGDGYDQETALIIAMMRVLPKHYWHEKNRDFSKTTLEPPLGSGPYKIQDFEQGRQIRYQRVENYWAADHPVNRGSYNFDQIVYDFYRDETIALQAFESGAFDLHREWQAHRWKRDYNFKAIETGEIIKGAFKHSRPNRARFLIYNTRKKIFQNRDVRYALAHGFDFEWINKNLFNSAYERMNSIFVNSDLADQRITPFIPRTDGSGLRGIRKNLKTAQKILHDQGWQLENGQLTHIVTKQIFEFEILLGNPAQERIALEFARHLKRLGIKAKIRTVDSAQYIRRLQDYDFDMTINDWRNSLSPGTEQAVYWGSASADLPGGLNYSGVKNLKIDRYIADLTQAQTREELINYAKELDYEIMKNWYGIPLYYSGYDYIAYRSDMAHPDTTPIYGPIIETWWKK